MALMFDQTGTMTRLQLGAEGEGHPKTTKIVVYFYFTLFRDAMTQVSEVGDMCVWASDTKYFLFNDQVLLFHGIPLMCLDGQTTACNSQQIVQDFNDPWPYIKADGSACWVCDEWVLMGVDEHKSNQTIDKRLYQG